MDVGLTIDRLSIVADDAGMDELVNSSLIVQNRRLAAHPYRYQWDIVGGGLLQYAMGTNVPAWRIDVNPNKSTAWEELLAGLKYPRVTRIDIAVDYYGYDLSGVEWLTEVPMKRNWWTGRDGKLETLYIGSPRSELRYRIYDKRKEREQDEEMAAAPDAREGGTREPGGCPTRTGAAPDCSPWWRVEAQIRYGEYVRYWADPFEGLQGFVGVRTDGMRWEDEATVLYLRTVPGAWGRLSKNARTKWRKIFREQGEELRPSPSEVFKRDVGLLKEKWEAWKAKTCQPVMI